MTGGDLFKLACWGVLGTGVVLGGLKLLGVASVSWWWPALLVGVPVVVGLLGIGIAMLLLRGGSPIG